MGYEIRLVLYCNTETWRDIKIPNITFKQLHGIIQKLFNFDDYHNYEFRIPQKIPEEDKIDLNNCIKTVRCYSDEENELINKIFDEYDVILYEYDFGESWEIIITKLEEIDYKNKTALLTDYEGKYSPMDDIGGAFVFDELVQSLENDEEISDILEYCNIKRGDLSKMNFEKKYKKGSRIRINW